MTGIAWEPLAPGVARCRLSEWDATVGLVWGPRGALLIDCGASYAAGQELRAAAESFAGQPVRWLVLTHPHFDHILGAGAFSDVTVYAGVDGLDPAAVVADAAAYGADAAQAEADAGLLPAVVAVADMQTVDVGDALVHLVSVGRAHSCGDLVVVVPGEPPVVFTGDVVEESGEPQAGPDADVAAWVAALGRVRRLGGPDASYVPGHGAVVDAAFLRAQAAHLRNR